MTPAERLAIIFVAVSLLPSAFCGSILVLMGSASHSNQYWNRVILDELVKRGHVLHVGSPEPSVSQSNVTYYHFEETYKFIDENYNSNNSLLGALSQVQNRYNYQIVACQGILKSEGFGKLMDFKDETVELILYDLEAGPCLLQLLQMYPDRPVIGVSAFKVTPEILQVLGGHSHPSYNPFYLIEMDYPMTYWNKLYNTLLETFAYFYRQYVLERVVESLFERRFQANIVPLTSLYNRFDIALVNSHPLIDRAQSLPANLIEVGGLQIRDTKPLFGELETFINNAESGVILISFGLHNKERDFNQEQISIILEVIKMFPNFHFLWSVEKVNLITSIPGNLMMRSWLPQQDILGHPRVKGFITSAGRLSLQEAIWHGVPIIALPFTLDQANNARNMKAKGCGTVVFLKHLSHDILFDAISRVLFEIRYRTEMQNLQKQFHDRQQHPLDAAVWWIERMMREPRPTYLAPNSRGMSWFLTGSFDVMLILLLFSAVFLTQVYIVIKHQFRDSPKATTKHKGTSSRTKKIKKQ